jgi:hypothetical protein
VNSLPNSSLTAKPTDSAVPMELVILPALIGAVVWICSVLMRFAF